ncbi:hypothetical protein [Tomitella gaofuii]|uniref:hypothetical protein n=1 Tax=Tomitella gaofuii TaxID=2760083 RepID=UPI0015FB36C2|nr:hypothetical protein [Tomitella gaofuii]
MASIFYVHTTADADPARLAREVRAIDPQIWVEVDANPDEELFNGPYTTMLVCHGPGDPGVFARELRTRTPYDVRSDDELEVMLGPLPRKQDPAA